MEEILRQLVGIVYHIIYKVLYIPGGARFLPSRGWHDAINSNFYKLHFLLIDSKETKSGTYLDPPKGDKSYRVSIHLRVQCRHRLEGAGGGQYDISTFKTLFVEISIFPKLPWKKSWLINGDQNYYLREPQHTPGAYPMNPQTPKRKEFLHKLLVGGLFQEYVGKILGTILVYWSSGSWTNPFEK